MLQWLFFLYIFSFFMSGFFFLCSVMLSINNYAKYPVLPLFIPETVVVPATIAYCISFFQLPVLKQQVQTAWYTGRLQCDALIGKQTENEH